MKKMKALLGSAIVGISLLAGAFLVQPAEAKKLEIEAFPRIELVDNDIHEADDSVTVTQGSTRWVQWEAVGVKGVTIAMDDDKAKFDTKPLSDKCKMVDGSPIETPCTKGEVKNWALLRSDLNRAQYGIYTAPGTTIAERVLYTQTTTFRHKVTFDKVGDVKIVFLSTKVDGTPAKKQTLLVHVVPRGGDSFMSFEMSSFTRQNLSPSSDEGTSTDNGIGLGFNIISNEQLVLAGKLKTRVGFAAINDTNLFMAGGQNLVTAFTAAPELSDRDGTWSIAPSVSMLVEPATGTVLNPGVSVGLKAHKKFYWFTDVFLRTEMASNFVESCNSGAYGEVGINLLGLHSPWKLNLLLGATIQGKLTQPNTVTTSPYAGLGAEFRLFGGNAEVAITPDLYTGVIARFNFKTGIPDFGKSL